MERNIIRQCACLAMFIMVACGHVQHTNMQDVATYLFGFAGAVWVFWANRDPK